MDHSDYTQMQDEEIVALAQNGDEDAETYLLLKYKNIVRARVRSYFLAGADKDDLLQEGMIGLYKAVRDYQPNLSSFVAFADLCIKRQIFSAVKAAGRQKHLPLNQSISLNQAVAAGGIDAELPRSREIQEQLSGGAIAIDPQEIFLDEESHTAMWQQMQEALSPLEQTVLKYYLAGNTYTEIAKAVGRPEKSIDNALQRIKSKLSCFLQESSEKTR